MTHVARGLAPMLLAVICCLLGASPAHAQMPQLYRVQFHDADDLAGLAAQLDVWEVNHDEHWVLAPLAPSTVTELASARTVTVAPNQSGLASHALTASQLSQDTGIPGYACYRTLTETEATLADLVESHPNLAELHVLGPSWERATLANGGHELLGLILTNRLRTGEKPVFALIGAIHARELTTAETALRFAEWLLANYDTDPTVTWLLDNTEIHVIPVANPDGRVRAETGLYWRKNTNSSLGQCSEDPLFGGYGVDLNRNSSFQWAACPGCSSGNACAVTYRGTSPASEPETSALEDYLRGVFHSRRPADFTTPSPAHTPGLLISLHSYGRLVLFPWGWTRDASPNFDALNTLGSKFGYHLDYRVCQGGADNCLYRTDGTTDDWAYGELGIAAYTFELGTAFFQDCDSYEEQIFPQVMDALRYAALVTPRPFEFPAGPDIITLTATAPNDGWSTLDLAAESSRYAGSSDPIPVRAVTAARYTLNANPWDAAAPTWPFTQTSDAGVQPATFTTALEAACLPAGRHTVVAQSMNESGHWGAPAVTHLTIDTPRTVTAALSDATAMSGAPLLHTLVVTNTGTTTTTYALNALPSVWIVNVPTSTIGPLPAGASTELTVETIAPNQNAGAIAPAGIEIRGLDDPTTCVRVYATATVQPWRMRLPLMLTTLPSEPTR